MKSIKKQVCEYIMEQTSQTLYAQDYHKLGFSAIDIAGKFFIDRSNASRTLNQLFQDGQLCKKVGRPTLYISIEAVNKIFPNNTLPKIISAGVCADQFLIGSKTRNTNIYTFSFYFHEIGYSLHEAMYEPIEKAKRILLYPNQKKLMFINGNIAGEKKQFMQNIMKYLYAVNYIPRNIKPVRVESKLYSNTFFPKILQKYKDQKIIILTLHNPVAMNQLEELQRTWEWEKSSLREPMIILVDLELMDCSDYINALYPIVSIPQYIDLTAKEKIEYVFTFIHQEAKEIQKMISFTKNLVCCLVLCNMVGSLDNLKSLVHKTCINAYDALVKPNHELILTLEDLPNEILYGIEGTTQYMEQINQVFRIFSVTTFYAFPQIEFIELNILLHAQLNEKKEIMFSDNEEANTILASCKSDISAFQHIYLDDTTLQHPLYISISQALHKTQLLDVPYHTILSFHLFRIIHSLKNKDYEEKSILNERSEFVVFSKEVLQLFSEIEQITEEALPIYERMYINTFIIYCHQLTKKSKIGIIFCLSDRRLSEVYRITVNQRYGDEFSISSNINFSKFYDNYDQNYRIFSEELRHIDSHREIIILTDTYLPFNLIHKLGVEIRSDIKIVSNLSDVQLKKIHELYISDQLSFKDFQPLEYIAKETNTEASFSNDEHRSLLEVLNQTLQLQLSFLNAYKIVPLLKSIFHNIILDLSIEYSNNLLITFLMHSSFLLERTIKNKPLPYKGLQKLQRQHIDIYNAVYKNFKLAEEFLNCRMKETELAYVVELFVDASINIKAQ